MRRGGCENGYKRTDCAASCQVTAIAVSLRILAPGQFMEIRTLENTTLDQITSTFNEAFQGYFVPLVFTEESMAAKMKSEGIQLQYSIGAFDAGRLVGFILHGYDEVNGVKTIYNAGTGVIATYRGRNLTQAMYEYAIPLLAGEGIHSHVLEVIETNFPALHVYQKLGFSKTRKLQAFRGIPVSKTSSAFIIQRLHVIPEEAVVFADITAAWQNSLASVARDLDGHQLLGAYENEQLIGFAAFVAANGRIKQIVVHPKYRRRGVGKALLSFIAKNSAAAQLVVTNVDETYEPAVRFLTSSGFTGFLGLYEMHIKVSEGEFTRQTAASDGPHASSLLTPTVGWKVCQNRDASG